MSLSEIIARFVLFFAVFARVEGPRAEPPGALFDTCPNPPYYQYYGADAGYWYKPDCTGDLAGSATAPGGLQCGQWSGPGDSEGGVHCADLSFPVASVYYRDAADIGPDGHGKCKQWLGAGAPWYRWRSCGNKPLPP